ncbi:ABC transporter family substrate-binding protein [Enemella sp. A6]|uniref:ABC transporter family substrate-binding protein n=1 Tax=Enemella sp. A6 TaxID=3440152 RepID=UPI003EBACA32
MKFTTRKLAALAAVLALGLSACAGDGQGGGQGGDNGDGKGGVTTEAQYNPKERDEIEDGGKLTTSLIEITPQFNVFHADGTRYTRDVWRWYNPVMAYFTPEGEWSFNPDYLTDVKEETVDGNTKVTFTIRDEATFNDGTPIDWKAFEATWKTNSGKDDAYAANSTDGYSLIKSVTKGDTDKVAVVEFDGMWVWWQGLFNDILHPKAAAADVYNQGYINKPHPEWGAGPYKLKSYDQNAGTVVFERNEKWWGDEGKLDERIFRAMEDTAAVNAFKNGELDAIGAGNAEVQSQIKDVADTEMRKSVIPSSSLFVLNADSEKLKDDKVREALMKGFDRSQVAAVRFNGIDYTEELPGSLTLFPYQEGYQDNVAKAEINFDKEGAEKLLDEAGWTKGDDGIREKDGEKLSLTYPLFSDLALTQNLAKAMQAMYKEIGVDLQIDQRSGAEFSNTMTNKTFDAVSMGFASSDPFGVAYFCQIWCSDSQLNKSGTGTKELDEKIQEMMKLGTQEEQIEKANELEAEAFHRYGLLPLWNGPEIIATKKGLANFGADMFYVGPVQDIGWEKK